MFLALMVGHSNPIMVEALAKAAGEGTLYGMPHDREVRAAELICERFSLEQMRFTNSGSEATMHGIRLARTYTGRDKIVKFEGAYHGGHDTVLVLPNLTAPESLSRLQQRTCCLRTPPGRGARRAR